jgi:hypothetical protein
MAKNDPSTMLERFEYIMHGKVFRFKDNTAAGQLKADVSVGAKWPVLFSCLQSIFLYAMIPGCS